ncbi:MAG TPA: hypothetical protein VJA65_00070, partial [bacterium]|nr:hypothetical protein [bacterium]
GQLTCAADERTARRFVTASSWPSSSPLQSPLRASALLIAHRSGSPAGARVRLVHPTARHRVNARLSKTTCDIFGAISCSMTAILQKKFPR